MMGIELNEKEQFISLAAGNVTPLCIQSKLFGEDAVLSLFVGLALKKKMQSKTKRCYNTCGVS